MIDWFLHTYKLVCFRPAGRVGDETDFTTSDKFTQKFCMKRKHYFYPTLLLTMQCMHLVGVSACTNCLLHQAFDLSLILC